MDFDATEYLSKLQKTVAEPPMPSSPPSRRPGTITMQTAQAVQKLLGFYPPLDVNEPEAFIAGIATIFGKYPDELVALAVEPDGIPSRVKYLNSLAAIKAACDEIYEPIVRRMEREAIERGPKMLGRRRNRTPEEQAAIDEQVARVRADLKIPDTRLAALIKAGMA
jgi:hypothetical protein